MFRLLRFLLTLILLAVLVYVAVAVPLGKKTIWQHLRAIAGSKESQELVDEVKEKAKRVLHKDAGAGRGTGTGTGKGDELTDDERRQLRKLIKDRLGTEPKK